MRLVGTTAEGEDDHPSVVRFEARSKDRAWSVALEVADGPDDLEQQPQSLLVELGAEDLHGGGIGNGERALRRGPRDLPVDQSQELELGVHLGEVDLDPLLIDDAPAVGELGFLRPLPHFVVGPVDDAGRAERDAFVVELIRDQAPSAVLLADEVLGRHANVVEEHCVDVVLADQAQRLDRDAGGVERDDDDADALVLGDLWIGAHGEPAVVGAVGQAGPHLLAVDDVLLAIADSARLEAGEVGAGIRFAVTDAEV